MLQLGRKIGRPESLAAKWSGVVGAALRRRRGRRRRRLLLALSSSSTAAARRGRDRHATRTAKRMTFFIDLAPPFRPRIGGDTGRKASSTVETATSPRGSLNGHVSNKENAGARRAAFHAPDGQLHEPRSGVPKMVHLRFFAAESNPNAFILGRKSGKPSAHHGGGYSDWGLWPSPSRRS